MKTDQDLLDEFANALGRPEFNLEKLLLALKEKADQMSAAGQHPGELWALMGILPDLVATCRDRY